MDIRCAGRLFRNSAAARCVSFARKAVTGPSYRPLRYARTTSRGSRCSGPSMSSRYLGSQAAHLRNAPLDRSFVGESCGSALAAAGRAAHGEAQLRRRAVVVVMAGAHDRPHGTGADQAVANEPLVDIAPDHLAELYMAVGGAPLVVGKGHGLPPFAFERAG